MKKSRNHHSRVSRQKKRKPEFFPSVPPELQECRYCSCFCGMHSGIVSCSAEDCIYSTVERRAVRNGN